MAFVYFLNKQQYIKYLPYGVTSVKIGSGGSWDLFAQKFIFNKKLDGYIVWNAHNTVFSSKSLVISAQAVYFLHSTKPSVTWLNRRWWLAACDWVMSGLSAVLSTRFGRRRKFGEVACTYVPKVFIASPIDVFCKITWNLADGKLVKSCVAYLTKTSHCGSSKHGIFLLLVF